MFRISSPDSPAMILKFLLIYIDSPHTENKGTESVKLTVQTQRPHPVSGVRTKSSPEMFQTGWEGRDSPPADKSCTGTTPD